MLHLGSASKAAEPVRYDYGAATQSGGFSTTIEPVSNTDGLVRRHVLTPAFNCWTEFTFSTICLNVGTDWGRIDVAFEFSPAPPVLTGQVGFSGEWGRALTYAHPTTGWTPLATSAFVPLTKNVTYTVAVNFIPTSQTWNYYRGDYAWFERGPLLPRLTT